MSSNGPNGQISRYRCFVAVAERGGFSAAARELGCNQSSVSRQVAALEAEVGLTLIQRTKRSSKISLTQAGEVLLPRARAVCNSVESFRDSADALGKGRVRTLVLLSALGGYPRWLVDALLEIRPEFPDLRLQLRTVDAARAQGEVFSDAADLALVRDPDRGGMTKRFLGWDQLVAVCRPGLLDAPQGSVETGELLQTRLFVAGDAVHELGAVSPVDLRANTAVVSRDAEVLLHLAESGRGCALVWRSALPGDLAGLSAVPIADARWQGVCVLQNAARGGVPRRPSRRLSWTACEGGSRTSPVPSGMKKTHRSFRIRTGI